jgi:hypothetical protein
LKSAGSQQDAVVDPQCDQCLKFGVHYRIRERRKSINIYHKEFWEAVFQYFNGIKSLTADEKINENRADITLTRKYGRSP